MNDSYIINFSCENNSELSKLYFNDNKNYLIYQCFKNCSDKKYENDTDCLNRKRDEENQRIEEEEENNRIEEEEENKIIEKEKENKKENEEEKENENQEDKENQEVNKQEI